MDPLSVTSGIIAVIQATGFLVAYVSDAKDAPSDQARFAKEAQSLSELLTNLVYRLGEGKGKPDAWYTEVDALGKPDGPLGQYRAALEKLQGKIKSREGLAKIGNVLLWKFIKEDVASILLQIERIKSLIQIALQMDHFQLSQAIKDCLADIHSSNKELKGGMNAVTSSIPVLQDGINKIQIGQEREQDEKLLKWISSTDYPSQLSDTIARRQEGTGQWFLESPEFNNWLSGRDKTLFCPGIPGAGKTMVSAIAVDHLHKTIHDHSIGVAYVFCNFKVQKEQNTRTLLSAIFKQLVQAQPSAGEAANALYKLHFSRGTMATVDEISNALKLTLKHFSTVYIVVDALDECSDEYQTPLRFLEKLWDLQNTEAAKLEVRASPHDVTKFVKGQIPRLKKCVQRDNDLQREIEEYVVKAVEGMFLLARLQVDSLLDKTTKSKVRSTLKKLASGEEALDKAYDDAIKRIEAQPEGCSDLAKRVLTWISYAERPLTIEELRHALAVNPGDTDLDRDNFEDMEDIVSSCAGLVTVDDTSNIVRLIHYTTQEYFLRIRQDWNPTAQQDITTTCLTYLSFDPFKTGVSTDFEEFDDIFETYIFLHYISQHWAQHAMTVQEQVLDLALIYLKDKELVSYVVYSMFELMRKIRFESVYGPHRINATGVHITAKLGLNYLLRRLLMGPGETSGTDAKDDRGRTPLSWAAEQGQLEAVELLVEREDVNADSKDNDGRSPLSWAARQGQAAVVKLLIERDDVNTDSKDNNGRTPFWVAGDGQADIVKLLVERSDVDADSKDNGGRTPLSWLAEKESEEAVKLLLQREDVNINSKDNTGRTPLTWAAEKRQDATMKLLLERDNIIADSRDDYGRTPLSCAAQYGTKETVALLVQRDDVNADSKDDRGRTPLSWATSESRQIEVVKLLVDRGDVDADSKDNDGRTPLSHAATRINQRKGVRRFFRWGDFDAKFVKLFLDREDVDANSKDNEGLTPLMWAAKYSWDGMMVIEIFMEHEKVDVNLRDNNGHTALWWAEHRKHRGIVEMLKSKISPIER